MMDLNEGNFEGSVIKSKLPVVVDFWAEWCGPCRIFSPVIEKVSKAYDGKVNFGKLNVDENNKIAQEYNIMSIPTVLIFEDGKVKSMSVGALPEDTFKKWLDKNL